MCKSYKNNHRSLSDPLLLLLLLELLLLDEEEEASRLRRGGDAERDRERRGGVRR